MTGRPDGSSGKYENVMSGWLAALDFVRSQQIPRLLFSHISQGVAAKNIVLLLLHAAVGALPKILGGLFYRGQFEPGAAIEGIP